MRVAVQWKDRLNLAGNSTINLHARTVPSLAVSLVGSTLATRKLTYIALASSRMIVHGLVSDLIQRNALHYFNRIQSVDGLANLVTKSIRDMRLADLSPDALRQDAFESTAKANDLRLIFEGYCKLTNESGLADYADCVRLARIGILDGSIELPQGLLVILPEHLRLSVAEQGFLDAVAKRCSVCNPEHLESFSEESRENESSST